MACWECRRAWCDGELVFWVLLVNEYPALYWCAHWIYLYKYADPGTLLVGEIKHDKVDMCTPIRERSWCINGSSARIASYYKYRTVARFHVYSSIICISRLSSELPVRNNLLKGPYFNNLNYISERNKTIYKKEDPTSSTNRRNMIRNKPEK